MITPIDYEIKGVSNDRIVKEYAKKNKVAGDVFRCSRLTVFGTDYKSGEYVLLPDSTNNSPVFGKIANLFCSADQGYLKYQKTSNTYCMKLDIFYIKEEPGFDLIPVRQLADYHPLIAYTVTGDRISISLRRFILEHIE